MRRSDTLLLCILIALAANPLAAQDNNALQEYARLVNHLLRANQIEMRATVRLYATNAPNVILDQSEFSLQRDGDLYRVKYPDGRELVRGKNVIVVVDHEDRFISVDSFPDGLLSAQYAQLFMFPETGADSLLELSGYRAEYKSRVGSAITLQVSSDRSPTVKAIEIMYGENFAIQMMRVFTYAASEDGEPSGFLYCLEYHYSTFTTSPRFQPGLFSGRDFFSVQAGRLRPVANYGSYTLSDNTAR